MMRTCSADQECAKVHAPWPSGQVRAACTQREPTGRAIIVIVTEREEKREEKEKRKRTTEERERKGRGEREAPLSTFEPLPCVAAKRAQRKRKKTGREKERRKERRLRERREKEERNFLNLRFPVRLLLFAVCVVPRYSSSCTVTDGVCKDNTSNDPFSRC